MSWDSRTASAVRSSATVAFTVGPIFLVASIERVTAFHACETVAACFPDAGAPNAGHSSGCSREGSRGPWRGHGFSVRCRDRRERSALDQGPLRRGSFPSLRSGPPTPSREFRARPRPAQAVCETRANMGLE